MDVPRMGGAKAAVGMRIGVAARGVSKPFAMIVGKGGRAPKKRSGTGTGTGMGTTREKTVAPVGTRLTPPPSPKEEAKEGVIGREREGEHEGARGLRDEPVDWLDPAARHMAQLAPIGGPAVEIASHGGDAPLRGRSLEELLPALVKRIAWAGDRHRGTVRLELGAGAHAGTTVLVHAEGGRVRVEVGGAPEPELERLRARLDARLRAHGLDVESVT